MSMSANPVNDVVSNQYERFMYPQPIFDLRGWLDNNWQWFDPSHAHRIFWPDRDYKPALDILVAGCGTNQAAVLACTNPHATVVAIDVSQPSLDHHKYLKEKYLMKNLELHLLPIEEVGSLKRDFDLIISTGVLHHLADPKIGMQALSQCIRRDGVIALMLYAKYGRIGVEILQSVVRDLGFTQNDTSVMLVSDMLGVLPQNHPIKSYLNIAPDLQFDAGLVDTFLPERDRSFSIDDCIDLVTSSGLVFQDLFMKSPYYPPSHSASAFHASVEELPEHKQWSIMERINFNNACHFFTACRKDRPTEHYKINFSAETADQYVPSLRYRCTLNGSKLSRYNWTTNLTQTEAVFMQHVDGCRTISEIAALAAQASVFAEIAPAELQILAKILFQLLWRLDFLAIGLKVPTVLTN